MSSSGTSRWINVGEALLLERQSHGGQPRGRHIGGRGSQLIPYSDHQERRHRVGPPPSACTSPGVPWTRKLALLFALLLATEEQQCTQSVSHRSDAYRHVVARSITGTVPYQQRPITWRGSNAGLSLPGSLIDISLEEHYLLLSDAVYSGRGILIF